MADELQNLAALRGTGVLTAEEFEAQKAALLSRGLQTSGGETTSGLETPGEVSSSVLCAVVCALAMAGVIALAIPCSQYFPLFGGLRMFGQPWSPARMALIPGHLAVFFGFGVLTFAVLYNVKWVVPKRNAGPAPSVPFPERNRDEVYEMSKDE
jgi:hypothetical protein